MFYTLFKINSYNKPAYYPIISVRIIVNALGHTKLQLPEATYVNMEVIRLTGDGKEIVFLNYTVQGCSHSYSND